VSEAGGRLPSPYQGGSAALGFSLRPLTRDFGINLRYAKPHPPNASSDQHGRFKTLHVVICRSPYSLKLGSLGSALNQINCKVQSPLVYSLAPNLNKRGLLKVSNHWNNPYISSSLTNFEV
jgi:hypothetical protein